MAEVLGKISFLETPDVNGENVLINGGGIPTILSGITSAIPAAGQVGRLFLDITTNIFYRDNGTTWDSLAIVPLIDGTVNQVNVVDGTNVTPSIVSLADNLVMPGTAAFTSVSGSTAQRPTGAVGMSRFNTSLSRHEQFSGTDWLPYGNVLQSVSGNITTQSGTSQIPLDATAPLSTEGTQIWTQSFTPLSTTSRIIIEYSLTCSHGTNTRTIIKAVFAGTTNIGSIATTCAVASSAYPCHRKIVYSPGSTAAITFSCRAGASGSGTWYINSVGATNTLGGTLVSNYTITEVI